MTDNFSDHSVESDSEESNFEESNFEESDIDPSSVESSEVDNKLKPWQNFLIAFLFGALLSFVGLSISMSMTHTALASVSWLQWMCAIALPLLLGLFAVIFKEPFVNALGLFMQVLPY